ncbi:MAG: IMP cyclohydrolase [Limisphaerales bacterium]|jgi:IMP cyclohydrolase
MSFEDVIAEVQSFGEGERRRLMAMLVALQDKKDSSHAERLAAKIDDQVSKKWITLDDAEQKLGL